MRAWHQAQREKVQNSWQRAETGEGDVSENKVSGEGLGIADPCYLWGVLVHHSHRGPRGCLRGLKVHRNAFLENSQKSTLVSCVG